MSASRNRNRTRPSRTDAVTPGPGLDPRDFIGSRGVLVAVFVIAVATVLIYSNTFDASFHFDDFENIAQNESLRDLSSQWPPSGTRYLGYLSFALNYRIGGIEVFGYHLVNVLIHVCNGVLVFFLTALTLRTPALRDAESGPLVRRHLPLAAGLLFAVHPIQTQAVTYIIQRFASLATLFYLLSLVLYVQARLSLEVGRVSKQRAAFLYCLSIVAAIGAMKTKEISFTLPIVAAGYELLFFRPGRQRLLLLPLAATALLVPLGIATRSGTGIGGVLADASHLVETREIPRSVYLLTESRVVVTYLRLLLLPIGQNLDYDVRLSHSLAEPGVLLALVILLAVAGIAVSLLVRARKANRAAGVLFFFGVAWFFVTLSVESSFIPISDVIFEHRVYLPSAGAAVALATALLSSVERLRLRMSSALQVATALSITAGPLGAATFARNFVWKDETTLWSDVVAKSPEKGRAHNALGTAFYEKSQLDDAVREYREALRLDPRLPDGHRNLGVTYAARGRFDEAIGECREAVRLDPRNTKAHTSLADAYAGKGQIEDAIREYREAIRLDPGNARAHNNLAGSYAAKGQVDDAYREYREAFRLDPGLRRGRQP